MRFRAEYLYYETRKYGRQRQIVGKRESLRVTKGKHGERIDKRGEGRRECARLAGDKRAGRYGEGGTARSQGRAWHLGR